MENDHSGIRPICMHSSVICQHIFGQCGVSFMVMCVKRECAQYSPDLENFLIQNFFWDICKNIFRVIPAQASWEPRGHHLRFASLSNIIKSGLFRTRTISKFGQMTQNDSLSSSLQMSCLLNLVTLKIITTMASSDS